MSQSKYDLVVKDVFQRDHPTLLERWTGGVAVRAVLNVELARVEERRADLVLLLADGTLLHIEFQSANDKDMPYRMGIYCLLLGQKYRRRVRQVVLYIGPEKMRMANHVDLGQTRAAYTLMDVREIDARELIESGRPGDLALALLANGGANRMREILRRASGLGGAERQRVLVQLVALSGLRRLSGKLRMELRTMTAEAFEKNVIILDYVRDKMTKILRAQIAKKFKTVPKWADERLAEATNAQIERWMGKIIAAETIEGVLGKR